MGETLLERGLFGEVEIVRRDIAPDAAGAAPLDCGAAFSAH